MDIESKFWITKDGIKVFGEGPYLLLQGIKKFGSLSRASKELNMAYSKAWSIIKRAEKKLGYNLLESEVGGPGGGGSNLTVEGKKLLDTYREFSREAEESIEEIFEKYFMNV